MKIKLAYTLALFALPVLANTPPEITNVRASQRTDTKLVDIYYDAADADGDLLKVRIEISDNDGVKYSVPAFSLTGDIGEGIAAGKDKHIVWDAGTDWDGEYSDKMRVKVYAIDAQGFPGLEWGNEVPPGGFLMGQDGGAEGSGPSRHVNITWSYWLSKYEITNQQYCDFLNAAYAAGKITQDGYAEIGFEVMPYIYAKKSGVYKLVDLGDGFDVRWNVNNFEVCAGRTNFPVRVTFYGAAAFAHFYGYDLPTEAEWEKAARGPDNDDQDEHLVYPWGNTFSRGNANYLESYDPYEAGTTPVGYFDGNQTPIGDDMVNGYGLYDIAGNVSEWTRSSGITKFFDILDYPQIEDLFGERSSYTNCSRVVVRGGSFSSYPQAQNEMKIWYRRKVEPTTYRNPTYGYYDVGFRVVRRSGLNADEVVSTENFEKCSTQDVVERKDDVSRFHLDTSFGSITTVFSTETMPFYTNETALARSGDIALLGTGSYPYEYRFNCENISNVLQIKFWARSLVSGSERVYYSFYSDKSCMGSGSGSSVVVNGSSFQQFVVPAEDARYRASFCIVFPQSVVIDDIEIVSEPACN